MSTVASIRLPLVAPKPDSVYAHAQIKMPLCERHLLGTTDPTTRYFFSSSAKLVVVIFACFFKSSIYAVSNASPVSWRICCS